MPAADHPPSRRSAARDSGLLLAASVVAGLAAYAFVSLGTRNWGAAAFGPISVLWTIWVVTSASLTFPLQHWTIRAVATDDGDGGVRRLRSRLVRILAPATVIVAAALTLVRAELFLADSLVYPLAAAALVPASAALGMTRGVLAARDRYGALAVSVGSENIIRVLALGVLVVLDGPVTAAAGALLVGFVVLAAWPSALRLRDPAHGTTGELGTVASLASGQVAGQLLLAGPPIVLALLAGDPAAVTALFSAMALLRAPHLLLIGASPRLTDLLVRDTGGRGATTWARPALAGAAVAAPLVGLVFGPVVAWLLPAVFGPTVQLPTVTTTVATAGGWLALLTLLASLLALAEGRSRRIGVAWGVALVVGIPVLALGGPTSLTVVWWLAITELAALGLLLWPGRHGSPEARGPQATEGHHRANGRSN